MPEAAAPRGKDAPPEAHLPEFRQRAVDLARARAKPIAEIARDLGISESCLRRWMDLADVEDGHRPGLTSDERAEMVRCCCGVSPITWCRSQRSSPG